MKSSSGSISIVKVSALAGAVLVASAIGYYYINKAEKDVIAEAAGTGGAAAAPVLDFATTKAAAEKGDIRAQFNLGSLYEVGQGVPADLKEAMKWYQKAANGGDAQAAYTVANNYSIGRGTFQNMAEAVKWHTKAAELGEPLSMYNLAERYERGKEMDVDLVEAYKWHTLAAERGIADAAKSRDALGEKMKSEQVAEARRRAADFDKAHPVSKK